MRDSRGEIKSQRTMPCQGLPLLRSVKGHHKLPGGVDGVGGKIKRVRSKTVPSRERRIGEPRTKMVECKFGLRQQVRPAIRGERDVSRR